jgi:hypothetical protein
MKSGNVSVLNVSGANIPLAYERAIKEVWEKGVNVRTEYDRPEGGPSEPRCHSDDHRRRPVREPQGRYRHVERPPNRR